MKVLQPEVIKIINKLAEKYNLPAYVIEDINRAQFSYLRKMIKNAKLNNDPKVLLLHKFGKFYPSLNKIKRINDYNRKKRELLESISRTNSTTNSELDNQQSSNTDTN
jgi:hypothetical protein